MSRFDQIGTDSGLIIKRLRAEHAEKGLHLTYSQLRLLMYPELIENYIDAGNYDVLIDYLTDQWDTDCGDEFFVLLSKHLVLKGEKRFVIRLWRAVIGNRRHNEYMNATLRAMQHFLDALQELGDIELYSQAKEDMELFSQGKRPKLPKPDSRLMDEKLFWEVIEQTKSQAVQPMERPYQLCQCLEKFSAAAIKKFAESFQEKLLDAYRWDLWGVAYIAHGGCSDDGFLYFRAWLISEGKEVFETALADPESLVEIIDASGIMQLEGLLYAAGQAYERRANKALTIKEPKQQEPTGEYWSEQDLSVRFPKACKKFTWQAEPA